MATNRKLFLFVVSSVLIYLLVSLIGIAFHFKWLPFERVNLVSDLVTKDSTAIDIPVADSTVVIEPIPEKEFKLYQVPRFITNFSTDTSRPSLLGLVKKMDELKKGKKRKIRIAYFGDSMIEGDLLTQTLRKLLQQSFGGNGVGFVPITSQVSGFRQSVYDNYSGGWKDENFKSATTNQLFLSGHLFRSGGDWVQMNDQTIRDTSAIIEKSLLCGPVNHAVNIIVNDRSVSLQPDKLFNRIVIGKDKAKNIHVSVFDEQLPVYGISFESDTGIFVDNFSFRGITGIEFGRIDTNFLKSIAENNPYDLIVFQYGVNLLFRPNDKNFSWYARAILPVLKKIRNCFSKSEFLVVSTADRAFRYGDIYQSAKGIDSLVKIQATLAYETGSYFYNQFATMGGTNSIVDWAARNPSLANRDYVHPNFRGAELLGNYFFNAIMSEYQKYLRTRKK